MGKRPTTHCFSITLLPPNDKKWRTRKRLIWRLNRSSRRLSMTTKCKFIFLRVNGLSLVQDLSTKKCVACDSKDIRPMGKAQADELITKIPGWNLISEEGTMKLSRSWTVKSFTKGLELFQNIANVAEAEGHHPDLHLEGWNNVTAEILTHSVGGLTENDFILAAKINGLDVAHLLRIKPTDK